MRLIGGERQQFMTARGEATAATGYYRTPEEAFAKDRSHLPLIDLKWTDADFEPYKEGFLFVQCKRVEIQIIQRDAIATIKNLLTQAEKLDK